MVAELGRDEQCPQRRPVSSIAIAQAELRRRNRIFANQFAAIDERELLIGHADDHLSRDRKSSRNSRDHEQDRP